MIEIEGLTEETLWDLASFCYNHPEREETYVPGDRERFREGHRRRAGYLRQMLPRGARAQIAYEGRQAVGFIEYYPIEITNLELEGEDILVIWCINVREEARGRGVGSRLVQACLEDGRELGRKGVAVTCWDPVWMPRAIFEGHGFVDVGAAGRSGRILLRAFEPVQAPRWIGRAPAHRPVAGKVALDLAYTVRCPVHWRNAELIKEVAAELAPLIEIREQRTDERADMRRCGAACRTTLDGQLIAAGPLVDASRIREALEAALGRLRREGAGHAGW